VDLTAEAVVGLGTVRRRRAIREIAAIMWALAPSLARFLPAAPYSRRH
jgi:hypothetical protein